MTKWEQRKIEKNEQLRVTLCFIDRLFDFEWFDETSRFVGWHNFPYVIYAPIWILIRVMNILIGIVNIYIFYQILT